MIGLIHVGRMVRCHLIGVKTVFSFLEFLDSLLCLQDVLKKGTGEWKKVVAAFGEEILQADGEVDKPKLGQIVFSDPAMRQVLNG